MRHAVILAGGSGTRLWPASRRSRPKQFLAIGGDKPLITRAAEVGQRVAADRVLIVTGEHLAEATRAAVPSVEVVVEPAARNTAAAIGLAGALIAQRDPAAAIAFLPADHYVREPGTLALSIDACLRAAEHSDEIALVGIQPTRPETGYGYLKIGPEVGYSVRRVLRFAEKPDKLTAGRYVAGKRHLWNAGIFCLTAKRLLAELDTHLPMIARAARETATGSISGQILYSALGSVSFDKGVMEKTDRIVASPTNCGWSDVGSWNAISEVRGADASGNVIDGQVITINGRGNIIVADDGSLIAAVGVSDLVVVKSGDAVLVMRKDQAQQVREVVEALETRGLGKHL